MNNPNMNNSKRAKGIFPTRKEKPPKSRCPMCNSVGIHENTIPIKKTYSQLLFRCSSFECNTRWRAGLGFEAIIQNKKISSERLKIIDAGEIKDPPTETETPNHETA